MPGCVIWSILSISIYTGKKNIYRKGLYAKNKIGLVYVSNFILSRPSEVHGLVSGLLRSCCGKYYFVLSYFIACFVFFFWEGGIWILHLLEKYIGLRYSCVRLVSGSKEICLHFTFTLRHYTLSFSSAEPFAKLLETDNIFIWMF